MNIAIILAAGISSRITISSLPKQFIVIDNSPIIMHTLLPFLNNRNINHIIIVGHSDWIFHLQTLVNNLNSTKVINIITGANSRNKSLQNAIQFIHTNLKMKTDDIILTHDAARMFIQTDVIDQVVANCKQYGATNLVDKIADTVCLVKNSIIEAIPNRNDLYLSQTPQTFKWNILYDTYANHYDENTTDACSMVLNAGYQVSCVHNETINFKITTNQDLMYAKYLKEVKKL